MKKYVVTLLTLFIVSSIFSRTDAPLAGYSPLFTLPPLPYSFKDLEPYISEETVRLHYGKHTKGYLEKVNSILLSERGMKGSTLETVAGNSDGSLYNNAAQAWNHIFYFDAFSPHAQTKPSAALLNLIDKRWGSFDNFKKEFADAATSVFGSGWVWLVKNNNGALEIVSEPNAGTILKSNYIPLLGVDVWEHAYYLDYQNRRAEHIDALWNIIDWGIVQNRLN